LQTWLYFLRQMNHHTLLVKHLM